MVKRRDIVGEIATREGKYVIRKLVPPIGKSSYYTMRRPLRVESTDPWGAKTVLYFASSANPSEGRRYFYSNFIRSVLELSLDPPQPASYYAASLR